MTHQWSRFLKVLGLAMASLLLAPGVFAESLDNRAAIGELDDIKAVYDVRKSDPRALDMYLKAIITNVENLEKEGVEADLVMVFISHSVKFINTAPALETEADYGSELESIAASVKTLQDLGVRMEACNGATRAFDVDNDTLLPGIEPVRSGFISLMGYQNNGYALVPVYD
ncbi:MAG: DsrE family protein [Guyparkeria sp.]|uniref:DsrE family protein n=1 Tax=Guyparkeria sp. TaxID=2035736 RepID=UPI00397DB7D6